VAAGLQALDLLRYSRRIVLCPGPMQRLDYALALGLSLIALEVRAQPSPSDGVRLSFVRADNATDCVTAPALEREMVRRMGRDPFAGAARQWIEGVVVKEGAYYEVQLFERDAEGTTLGIRRLREAAADCHKLDDAIVLAIALIIDPTAHLAPANPIAPASTPASKAASTQSPNVAASVATIGAWDDRTARQAPPARAALPPAVHYDAPTPSIDSRPAAAAFVSVDAVLTHGILPGVAPGTELVTRLPLDAKRRYALRLSALYLPEKRPSSSLGDLGYGLTAMEVGACAGRSRQQVAWYGCTAFGLGAVHTVVHSPTPAEPGDRLWMAFRLEAGLGLHIAGPVWLEARLFDLIAPKRWQFRVTVDKTPQTAFTQAILMPGAALGLGVHFD
jgi:hypothetical protein